MVQFLWVKVSEAAEPLVPVGVLYEASVKVLARAAVISRVSLRDLLLSSLTWQLAVFSSVWPYNMAAGFPCSNTI